MAYFQCSFVGQLLITLVIIKAHVIQREIVYVKQINTSHQDTEYPGKVFLSFHTDKTNDALFELLLEKYLENTGYLDNSENDSNEDTEEIYHGNVEHFNRRSIRKHQKYQVRKGLPCVTLKRLSGTSFHMRGDICFDGDLMYIEPADNNIDMLQAHYVSLKDLDNAECVTETKYHQDEDEDAEEEINIKFALSNAFDTLSGEAKMKDRVKRETEHLTIELLLVIDYAAYSWWGTLSPGNTDSDTMALIRQYYAYVFQGIDSRFNNIEKQPLVLDLAFSGLFVAKTEHESYWTTSSIIAGDGDSIRVMVNSSEALDKFQKWLDDADFLPKYDHAILFTGTNLTYAGSPGNTGLAFASSMCRNISNSSIVEDIFDYRTITYATQQVARALGTMDDMDNNDCLEFFNYIMSPKFKLPIKSFASNRWQFSQCSEQYLTEYNTKLNEDGLTCLRDTSLVERYPTDLAKLIDDLPGVVYSGRRQCEHAFGLKSVICRIRIGTRYSKMCHGLLCTYPGTDQCGYILPADGTLCGNKKYCLRGSCVEHEHAVETSDSCVFGNDPTMNCYNLVVNEPYRCYTESIRHKCCKICELFQTGITGCEYGDRSDDCSIGGCVNGDPAYADSACCLTCLDGPTPYAPPLLSTVTEALIGNLVATTTETVMSSASSSSTSLSSSPHSTSSSASISISSSSPTSSSLTSLIFSSSPSTLADTLSSNVITTNSNSETSIPSLQTNEETEIMTYSSTLPATQQTETTDMFTMLNVIPQSTKHADYEATISSTTATVGTIKSVQTTAAVTSQTVTDNTSPGWTTSSPYAITDASPYSSTDASTTAETATDTTDTLKHVSTFRSAKTSETTDTTTRSTSNMLCTCPKNELPTTTLSPTTQSTADTGDPTICNSSSLKDTNQFIYNRIFFKDLARSMKDNQRHIRYGVRQKIKSLYIAVSGQLRGLQREFETENESGREGSEMPSNDDDDVNRKLRPIWRQHYNDMMGDLKKNIRHMRYRVLALTNRHFSYGSQPNW